MAIPMTPLWPELDYAAWQDARATLHLWTQIVGKIRLRQTPWLNHGWHVALYVTSTGLTSSPIPHGSRTFDMQFDFIRHSLDITVSDGGVRRLPLQPQSVADFYGAVMAALDELGVAVAINPRPCEIEAAIPFIQDRTHAAYDPDYAQRFWLVLLHTDQVMKKFRTGFLGKCSPVHFFWGSFDLAVTRFSGRRAPPFAGKAPGVAPQVMREAYSHEVSSAGFWPGGNGTDYPAFYSYALRGRPHGGRSARHAACLLAKHLRGGGQLRELGSCCPRVFSGTSVCASRHQRHIDLERQSAYTYGGRTSNDTPQRA